MKRIRQALKNEKGLTLVELLAVIVILGIIAAIAIPSVGGIIQNSKEDAVKADAIQVIEGAKLLYASEDVKNLADADGEVSVSWGDGLSEYVQLNTANDEDTGLETSTIVVEFDDDGIPSITATGVAGGETMQFNTATIEDINESDESPIGGDS